MYDLMTFGELMFRLSPFNSQRLLNAAEWESFLAGSELNVAVGFGALGGKSCFLSKIPDHALGKLARRQVVANGVSDEFLFRDESKEARVGLYFYEKGSSPRKPEAIYDRRNSSFLSFDPEELPDSVWEGIECFHTSGTTLALNPDIRDKAIVLIKKAKEHGVKVSFDVNFRGNLWTGAEAKECIEGILPMIDIFFCTEDTARLTFLKSGTREDMMKEFAKEYDLSYVGTSVRHVHRTKDHDFSSVLYDAARDQFYEEKPYEHIEVVDRIGSGDAYVSGVLYGLLMEDKDPAKAVSYGNAMGVLKNTIAGDFLCTTKEEVLEIMNDHIKTGYVSEVKR